MTVTPSRVRLPQPPWFVAFLARRLVWALVTMLVFLAIVVFVLEIWVPYSWETLQSRGPVDDDRNYLGVYAEFLVGLARADLGTSFGGSPVAQLISEALPVTLTVFLVGTCIGWIAGELLGRIGSWNRSAPLATAVSTLGVLSAAVFPPFLVFLLVFALRDPLLASRDAIGLPRDSLDLWRGALIGEEGALVPPDVWWAVALALSAAVVGALAARAVGADAGGAAGRGACPPGGPRRCRDRHLAGRPGTACA